MNWSDLTIKQRREVTRVAGRGERHPDAALRPFIVAYARERLNATRWHRWGVPTLGILFVIDIVWWVGIPPPNVGSVMVRVLPLVLALGGVLYFNIRSLPRLRRAIELNS